MGAAGSVRRSASSLQNELEKLRLRELNLIKEHEEAINSKELKHGVTVIKLESEKSELLESNREMRGELQTRTVKWKREQDKSLSLMFSDLPLNLLQQSELQDCDWSSLMPKHFPIVTVAKCDIVGFSSLATQLSPTQVIDTVDTLHAAINEAFSDPDIFIMENTTDGCLAVSGLRNSDEPRTQTRTPLSLADSSYGSETNFSEQALVPSQLSGPPVDADKLATAVLKLMSYSTKISVPCKTNNVLQLRIALHSGPCSAGVIGLQTTTGTCTVPHYKLFGPTIKYLHTLCTTSLALQIRVSKQCRDLLACSGEFVFERSPDYTMCDSKPIESYWLVSKQGLPLTMPVLSDAVSLHDYDNLLDLDL